MRLNKSLVTSLVLLAATAGGTAEASLLTTLSTSTSTDPLGNTNYVYTLTNEAASTLSAIALRIDVDPAADLTSIDSTAGWFATYSPGDSLISWESPSVATDIQPGNSAEFRFTSPLAPSTQGYAILGFDSNTLDFDFISGTTVGPSSIASVVPEPSTASMAASGLASLAAMLLWGRRRGGPRPA